MSKFTVTFTRGFGSGGRTIGKMLADRLNIPFYDKELIKLASEESGINESLFGLADESKRGLLFKKYDRSYGEQLISPESGEFTSDDNLFNYQAQVLQGLAEQESFVVIGRCADFVLKDVPNVELVRIFISASDKFCAVHEKKRLGITETEARAHIKRFNRRRSEYYHYYTGLDWGDMRHYDLGINATNLTVDECVEMILSYIDKRIKK